MDALGRASTGQIDVLGKVMHPLTPDNLLMRRDPVENDLWLDGDPLAEDSQAGTLIPLERFQALEHVVRDNPIHLDPYLELSKIYLKSRRWTDARRVLEAATQRFSDSEEANFLLEEAQIARSLQLLSEAQAEHDAEPTRLTEEQLGRCHVELNVLRERICRQRLSRHPEQVELNIPLATALENLGKRDEAVECLRRVVVLPRLRAPAALQLGQLYDRAGRVLEALSAYRRAAMYRVPPPDRECRVSALMAAADLAERTTMFDSARRYVELLLELLPDDESLKTRCERLRHADVY